jgi:hypothetical protein
LDTKPIISIVLPRPISSPKTPPKYKGRKVRGREGEREEGERRGRGRERRERR